MVFIGLGLIVAVAGIAAGVVIVVAQAASNRLIPTTPN
jgi:hypothetical protein